MTVRSPDQISSTKVVAAFIVGGIAWYAYLLPFAQRPVGQSVVKPILPPLTNVNNLRR